MGCLSLLKTLFVSQGVLLQRLRIDLVQRSHQGRGLDVGGIGVLVEIVKERVLMGQGAGRRGNIATLPSSVKRAEIPLVGMAMFVVAPERVAWLTAHTAVEPGTEALPFKTGTKKVAEEITAAAGANKQRAQQTLTRDAIGGREAKVRLEIDATVNADRGEKKSAILERIIPVTGDERTAARSPGVMRRHPQKVGARLIPAARLPEEAPFAEDPAAGMIKTIVRWRRHGGT
jgi:hypothetical protein